MTAGGGPSDPEPEEPPGAQAGQIVSLAEIRRTEAVISALAARQGLPPGARDDPAIMLLAALSRDVDTADGGVTPPPDAFPTAITGRPSAGAIAILSEGRVVNVPEGSAVGRLVAADRPLAAVATGWGHDDPAEDARYPRGARSGPSHLAGRRTVRTVAVGLTSAAAVVAMAAVAGPAWRGGSGGALTPLAGSLQSVGQGVPAPAARQGSRPATAPGRERPGAAAAGPAAPGRGTPGRTAVGGKMPTSPHTAGGTVAAGSTVAGSHAASQAGSAGPTSATAGSAGAGSAKAGRPRTQSAGAGSAQAGRPGTKSAGAGGRTGWVPAGKPVARQRGRRRLRPGRRTGAQPWKFWLAGP